MEEVKQETLLPDEPSPVEGVEVEKPKKIKHSYPDHFERFWSVARTIHAKPSKDFVLTRYKKRLEGWEGTPDEFADHLCLSITIEKDRRRAEQKAGKFVPQWCNWDTWLNQYRDKQEFTGDSHVELKEQAERLEVSCQHCGKAGQIHQELIRVGDRYACLTCHWEHHSGELRNQLRQGWALAQQRIPKRADESVHDYFRRWLKEIKKSGGLMRNLPYDKSAKVAGTDARTSQATLTGRVIERPADTGQSLQRAVGKDTDGFGDILLEGWEMGGGR